MTDDELIAYFEDRYTELYRLMGVDQAFSIDWYDGARAECIRAIDMLRRAITPFNPPTEAVGE